MAGRAIAEKVKALIAPIVAVQRLELVDVELKHEGRATYLRIFIDKPGGVTIDDCQQISRECEVVLDVEDLIRTQYVLEVSSPGLDRPLKQKADYQRFQQHLVKIKTFQPVNGRRNFLGYLQGLSEEGDTATKSAFVTITVPEGGEEIRIPYELIASARLEVEF